MCYFYFIDLPYLPVTFDGKSQIRIESHLVWLSIVQSLQGLYSKTNIKVFQRSLFFTIRSLSFSVLSTVLFLRCNFTLTDFQQQKRTFEKTPCLKT